MPRIPRAAPGSYCYHVLNRASGGLPVFREEADYADFVQLLSTACQRIPMRLLAFCLLPDHFHLALWPAGDDNLSTWMHWLMTTHVSRHRKKHPGTGHLWQGRFKAFPVQDNEHLLAVLRFIERNPLRSNLVARAEDWPWSSLGSWRTEEPPSWLHVGPVLRGADWIEKVNQPQDQAELAAIRLCVQRGRPFGSEAWVHETARQLGLESTLRPRGRPRKG